VNSVYNNYCTIINGTGKEIETPYKFVQFELNEYTLLNIKKQEVDTHKLFNNHIIITKDTEVNFKRLAHLDTTQNKVHCAEVVHSGVDKECRVDLSTAVCSSWALPFILDSKCNYGYLHKHRIKLFNLRTGSLL
jgi:hypothetical protein